MSVILYLPVPNIFAEGALVKGDASRSDLCELVGKFWDQMARLNCLVDEDRASTDSNPADGPPRPDGNQPKPELGGTRCRAPWKRELTQSSRKRAWEPIE